jgi:hypothetical protein
MLGDEAKGNETDNICGSTETTFEELYYRKQVGHLRCATDNKLHDGKVDL